MTHSSLLFRDEAKEDPGKKMSYIVAVAILSILLQLAAAVVALRLIRLTGNHIAWILIALAVALMAIRRGGALILLFLGYPAADFALQGELSGLTVSVLMLVGLAGIAPVFVAFRRSERKFRRIARQRRKAEKVLFETNQTLQALIQASPAAILAWDPKGTVTLWNPAAEAMFGWSKTEIVGHPNPIFPEDRKEEFRTLQARAIRGESITGMEITWEKEDGKLLDLSLSTAPMYDASGRVRGVMGVVADISEIKQAERSIQRLAYYDTLTGLPNRLLLKDRLGQTLVQASREDHLVGVLFLDLDRFKVINDTLGHAVGDRLLQGVAERLKGCIRKSDTVARLGGDEFLVILPAINQAEDATAITQKIIQTLASPMKISEQEVFTSTSIGIALYPADGYDADSLIRSADLAMYQAKEKGRNTYQFFSFEMNRKAQELLTLETDLRRALEQEQFVLYYQPQFDVATGRVTGMEALLRWRHPNRGLLSPDQFIPVAEDAGLIIALGEWVLRSACARNRAWQNTGYPPVRIAVNMSIRQLKHYDLVGKVATILEETGLDPRWLELELTERMLMENAETLPAILMDLKALGVGIAVDHFGTGCSSLDYLNSFPIDRLKIAPSFVGSIGLDPKKAAVAQAIITLAHTLNLQVIAEGVETEEQRNFLQKYLCEESQGFLLGKPAPAEEVETFLGEKKRRVK
jgi:diguanylate cyclase (GGDEF)-like protein/PAS domain S-box-containing protein